MSAATTGKILSLRCKQGTDHLRSKGLPFSAAHSHFKLGTAKFHDPEIVVVLDLIQTVQAGRAINRIIASPTNIFRQGECEVKFAK